MNTILKYSFCAIISCFFLTLHYGCKKDPAVSTIDLGNLGCASCPPPLMCTGDNSNLFLPLALNRSWTMLKTAVGYPVVNKLITVTGTKTFNGNSYYTVKMDIRTATSSVSQKDSIWNCYYRYVNGNLLQLDTVQNQEFIYLPAHGIVGQPLHTFTDSTYWQTMDTNTAVTTTACNYAQCLVMGLYKKDNSLLATYYFKRSVGEVKQTDAFSLELNSLTFP